MVNCVPRGPKVGSMNGSRIGVEDGLDQGRALCGNRQGQGNHLDRAAHAKARIPGRRRRAGALRRGGARRNADAADLTLAARRNGMRTLREDGWMKVDSGLTTAGEVLRVTQEF